MQIILRSLGEAGYIHMPTETENYIDEEILRNAERSVETERAREYEKAEEGEDNEDVFKVEELTDDPILQDVLEHKGGMPEDWELTHSSSGEYVFNGTEIIHTSTGESLTKSIENSQDAGYAAAHHEMLAAWKSGEMLTRLPDFEEQKENGDVVLHITHMIRGADNSVSYEIRSTIISRREEEELPIVEDIVEHEEAVAHVGFQEELEIVPQERVEVAFETSEYMHETAFDSSTPVEVTFETPVVQEVTPTIAVEQRTETVVENATGSVISEPNEAPRGTAARYPAKFSEAYPASPRLCRVLHSPSSPQQAAGYSAKEKKEVAQESWLYDFLKENIYVPEEERSEVQRPTSVAEIVEEKAVVEHAVAAKVEVAPVSPMEQPLLHQEAPLPHAEYTSPQQHIIKQVREVVIPKIERAIEVPKIKIEQANDTRPVIEKVEYKQSMTGVESPKTQVLAFLEKSSGKTVRSAPEIVRPATKNEHAREPLKDTPTVTDAEKSERKLGGEEIVLRVLGLPTAPRVIREPGFARVEGLRPLRYSPPPNDEAPVRSSNRNTLNGISMSRAA
ncbi:MAG: hypothetical protein Q8R25_00905 [bacterium]|nr:hypothetical protein [bacterium]